MKRTEAKRKAADGKRQILAWIEEDRDRIIRFLADFMRIATPNPPGDTRAARQFAAKFLDEQGLDYRVVDPEP